MNSQIETLMTPEIGLQNEEADLSGFTEVENVQEHRGLIESARFMVGRAIDAIGDNLPAPSRRLTAGITAAALSLTGGAFAGEAMAQTAGTKRPPIPKLSQLYKPSETLTPIAQTSTAQALADLNKQRVANGMLPVAESSAFDAFCQNYIKGTYKKNIDSIGSAQDTTQTNPGGTVDSISGGAGDGRVGQWNAKVNPWSNFPNVLDTIYDPIMTQTGYAETKLQWGHGQGCIETFGDRQWAAPTFYSVPGNGATVIPWETALPFSTQGITPGSAVGIPEGAKTGPYILLYPEGIVDTSVQSATLSGPNGPVGVKIVRPGMPYPASKGGGEVVSHANYVIPKPLLPESNYTLDANWVDSTGASHPQEVHFKTDTAESANNSSDLAHPICDGCPHGKFDLKTSGDKLRVELTPAVGQKVTVMMRLMHQICLEPGVKVCPSDLEFQVADRIVTDTYRDTPSKPHIFKLPHRTPRTPRATELLITATVGNFTAEGRQWPAAQSIGKFMKAPK